MNKIVVYTTNPPCPKCKVLKKKLDEANIEYTVENNIDVLTSKGFTHIPMLEVDNVIMNCNEAFKWINEREESNGQ